MSRIVSSLAAPGCFRLFLALLVFVDHSTRLNLGTAAVFIFFILSGYWIKVMWAKRYSHGPYLTYIVSRFWRLMPVFALGSCLSWMLLIARGARAAGHDALLHQFISNIFIIGYDLLAFRANGPAWSLDIEVQFYLVAPLLIAALNWSRWTLIPCLIVSVTMMLYDREQTLLPYVGFFALGISFAANELDAKASGRSIVSPWLRRPGSRLPSEVHIEILSLVAFILGLCTRTATSQVWASLF